MQMRELSYVGQLDVGCGGDHGHGWAGVKGWSFPQVFGRGTPRMGRGHATHGSQRGMSETRVFIEGAGWNGRSGVHSHGAAEPVRTRMCKDVS